jgi:hypothetical protein
MDQDRNRYFKIWKDKFPNVDPHSNLKDMTGNQMNAALRYLGSDFLPLYDDPRTMSMAYQSMKSINDQLGPGTIFTTWSMAENKAKPIYDLMKVFNEFSPDPYTNMTPLQTYNARWKMSARN